MKLLKQKSSGVIYVWTEDLAKRDDMEAYERPQVPTIVLPPEPTPKEVVEEVEAIAEVVKPATKKKAK